MRWSTRSTRSLQGGRRETDSASRSERGGKTKGEENRELEMGGV